ncbi:MAG TPA: hypothetical protein VJQ47_13660 [Steroidobacteraceae bacterium]|nr:hypothetical protein [Steroidobacteraceae bacterium]
MRPCYELLARAIAGTHPWEILGMEVGALGVATPGRFLTMDAAVRKHREDVTPGAIIESSIHVGATIQSPLVFWSLVLGWPAASLRQRWGRFIAAVPVFLCLEAVTTVCQLLAPLGQASAVLDGVADPVTGWDRWGRFMEAGGRILLALTGSVAVIALTGRAPRHESVTVTPFHPASSGGHGATVSQAHRG